MEGKWNKNYTKCHLLRAYVLNATLLKWKMETLLRLPSACSLPCSALIAALKLPVASGALGGMTWLWKTKHPCRLRKMPSFPHVSAEMISIHSMTFWEKKLHKSNFPQYYFWTLYESLTAFWSACIANEGFQCTLQRETFKILLGWRIKKLLFHS